MQILIYVRGMTERYRLHYAPDNASLVVRLALDELRQPYDTVLVDRATDAQKAPGYLELNPNGLIPTLETPDGPIFETGAILLWLSDRHGGLAPPVDSPERAAFLKWLFFLSNTLHPALRMIFYPHQYVGADQNAQTRLRHHMRGEVVRCLDRFEAQAAAMPGWLGSRSPSCLDLYLAPVFRWITLYPAPDGGAGWFHLPNWPHLHAMAVRFEGRASAVKAAKAEGLGETPFTAPRHATPPEGSAT